jgi:NAD(P)-dependent dehydrogenase (short-subunit alcohol dehydrogenase family)
MVARKCSLRLDAACDAWRVDVLITGASRGIGDALTTGYLARGARVFAGTRSDDASLGQLRTIKLDVTVESDIEAARQVVETEAGGLDLLINNAGVLQTSTSLSTIDTKRGLDLLKVNTLGPLMVAQHFAGLLRTGSRLVNITMPTSPLAKLSKTNDHMFVASRYALNALTRMIASELTHVTVVALWPGYLRTDMNNHAEAATPLDTAIPGVIDVIESIGPQDHGACLLPDGTHYAW